MIKQREIITELTSVNEQQAQVINNVGVNSFPIAAATYFHFKCEIYKFNLLELRTGILNHQSAAKVYLQPKLQQKSTFKRRSWSRTIGPPRGGGNFPRALNLKGAPDLGSND